MNKAKLKSYAPAARRDFIQAVTDRAHFYGLSEKEIIPVEVSGDVAIIGGRPFARAVAAQRKKLEDRVKREGFNQVMEAVAYTWFNRFLALRYMELHGYMEHGFRVLSNTGSSSVPEILDHAAQLDLPGLNKQKVVELKLDGSKDADLYRLLLVAQCNALHEAMPFLFEKIEDETELLLPDNLLHSDSLIRKLVTEIDEEDWQDVEIIGWLYQFYISEKKDQVIGKVVKSEDIPAATQLFTPNWIVKYLVQNSLGRQWLATYPNSPLKSKMEYYIEPAEQTDEVKKQLAAITPNLLDPEKLTLLDPASGSGHILVEAYDIFKEIYLERGYSNRDFPRLILEKNLFGLDIDDRAAQMAGFALLMKARKDDRRILRGDNPVKINVMAIQESNDIVIDNGHWGEVSNAMCDMVELFKHGKTFGSLIQVPPALSVKLTALEDAVKHVLAKGDLFAVQEAVKLATLLEQSSLLARKYDCVVANPPYMGSGGMNSKLKEYVISRYADAKADLFSVFIEQGFNMCTNIGNVSMITMHSWMFLSSFLNFRENIIRNRTIISMAHFGTRAFDSIGGEVVATTAFIVSKYCYKNYVGNYLRLVEGRNESEKDTCLRNKTYKKYELSSTDILKIPGCPIAYWAGRAFLDLFPKLERLEQRAVKGLDTNGNIELFLKRWFEVSAKKLKPLNSEADKWYPIAKGGEFRRWYGNHDFVINFENNGCDLKKNKANLRSSEKYFMEGLTWTVVSSSGFAVRYMPQGFLFDQGGSAIFTEANDTYSLYDILGSLNSNFVKHVSNLLCPTLNFTTGDVRKFPIWQNINLKSITKRCVETAKWDWDSYETSWDFQALPLITHPLKSDFLSGSWDNWYKETISKFSELQKSETEINRIFIDAYDLHNELTPEVPEDQITLTRAERETDMKRLISYSIGCMMGRYSIDQSGLVYANSGNIGFDHSKYQTFPADDDGIVPVMDMDWFPDDATSRIEEFLSAAWSPETLEENLKFVADSLSPKGGEIPRETIRRYVSTQFYKDHLQTYKKRPIYWLFSSGKQRAFECLVYLHRYNESTLSRMRNEYVTPLQGKFSAQVDYLVNEVNAVSSTAERNRLQKQVDTLRKKQAELASFDDLLRHYADQRIILDLDDGVKINYGKFGVLLAEVKAVTGGSE